MSMPVTHKLDSYVLLAGWVVDGSGAPVRERARIRIENGFISEIGTADEWDRPGPEIADFRTCTLLPGLVDGHVHLFMSGTGDPAVREAQLTAGFEDAAPVIRRHVRRHLSCGVVAVRDGGDAKGHVPAFKCRYVRPSAIPLILHSAGRAWRAPGRYGRLIGRPPGKNESLAHAITCSREAVDHVKIVNSGLNSLKVFGKETLPQFEQTELTRGIDAARRLGLKTMVHANGAHPARMAVDAGCHSVEHGFFMGSENLRIMAEKQVFWVPTAFTMKAYRDTLPPGSREAEIAGKNLEHQLDQIRLARGYGVPVCAGTDAGSLGVHHGEALREEIRLLMDAGFPLEGAVRCATSNGAALLGIEREAGLLKPGMPATFIAVRGGPEELPDSLRKPLHVAIRGKGLDQHTPANTE